MQPLNAPPATGVAASWMGPANVDLINQDLAGTGSNFLLYLYHTTTVYPYTGNLFASYPPSMQPIMGRNYVNAAKLQE
jgi:hypothetical protein